MFIANIFNSFHCFPNWQSNGNMKSTNDPHLLTLPFLREKCIIGMNSIPTAIMHIFECTLLVFCVLWSIQFIEIFLLSCVHTFLTDKVFCANYIKD